MKKKLDELYEQYSDNEITFNQKVIDSIGLSLESIFFKVGGLKAPIMIYTSSLKQTKVIVKLNVELSNTIRKFHHIVSLRYSFATKDKFKDISFFINSKIVSCDKYYEDIPDLYILTLEYLNRAPDDLIDRLGHYLDHQGSLEKRARERFVLNSNSNEKLGLNLMDNYLFMNGKGKRCYLAEISIFSAKVLVKGDPGEFKKDSNIMLLMKSEAISGLGEMIGSIGRVELINSKEGLYSVIISFNQTLIPPMYKMWVAQCIESIKVNSGLNPEVSYSLS